MNSGDTILILVSVFSLDRVSVLGAYVPKRARPSLQSRENPEASLSSRADEDTSHRRVGAKPPLLQTVLMVLTVAASLSGLFKAPRLPWEVVSSSLMEETSVRPA
jgi:hypothetical protein